MSGDNTEGGDHDRGLRQCPSMDEAVEKRGSLEADALSSDGDTGNRRVAQLADHLVVVDTKNGDVFGDAESKIKAMGDDITGDAIVASHDAHGLRQGSDPLA